jgi:HlyD family secretion protein
MSKMIFEGQVDEAEVGKLEEGSEIKVVLGALGEEEFPSKLTFVAPKGIEFNGAVQFTIKADVEIPSSKVKAGYSANAIIEIENTENTLCIKESLVQFNRFTEKPFVEILNEDGVFIKKNITIGLSDGISVEVLEGVEENDKIKVWNKVTEEDKGGDGETRPNS